MAISRPLVDSSVTRLDVEAERELLLRLELLGEELTLRDKILPNTYSLSF